MASRLDSNDEMPGLNQLPVPDERRAPISLLSNKSRSALVDCFKNGELQKHKGVWRGSIEGEPIHGNTVASLCRDGLFVAIKSKQSGSARLTERGVWFVRTLIAAEADHLIGQFQSV